jgi:hypothetical protein
MENSKEEEDERKQKDKQTVQLFFVEKDQRKKFKHISI